MFYICEYDDHQNIINLFRQEVRIEDKGGPSVTQWLRLEMLIFSPGENDGPKQKVGVCDVSEAVEEEKARKQSGAWIGPRQMVVIETQG